MRVCENIEGELTAQTRVAPDSSIKLRGVDDKATVDVYRRRASSLSSKRQAGTAADDMKILLAQLGLADSSS